MKEIKKPETSAQWNEFKLSQIARRQTMADQQTQAEDDATGVALEAALGDKTAAAAQQKAMQRAALAGAELRQIDAVIAQADREGQEAERRERLAKAAEHLPRVASMADDLGRAVEMFNRGASLLSEALGTLATIDQTGHSVKFACKHGAGVDAEWHAQGPRSKPHLLQSAVLHAGLGPWLSAGTSVRCKAVPAAAGNGIAGAFLDSINRLGREISVATGATWAPLTLPELAEPSDFIDPARVEATELAQKLCPHCQSTREPVHTRTGWVAECVVCGEKEAV